MHIVANTCSCTTQVCAPGDHPPAPLAEDATSPH
jgi:hypothetical protein